MVQKINPHPAQRFNRSPPYYVFSKAVILGSVLSISSEVLDLGNFVPKLAFLSFIPSLKVDLEQNLVIFRINKVDNSKRYQQSATDLTRFELIQKSRNISDRGFLNSNIFFVIYRY
jgi:hypothetical protein